MLRLERKRAAIIEAARPVFLREGWSGTSLERVAAEGGFSKMTVYRHFGSKEDLFEALVEDMCREIRQQAKLGEPQANVSAVELLDHLAREIVSGLMRPEALALYRLIIADGWRFPALARTFEQFGLAVLRKRTRDILKQAGLGGDEVDGRASGFINLVLGDAYLEAALGFDDPNTEQRFQKQIAMAVRFALASTTSETSRLNHPEGNHN
jgi:TetR/AcrR family transcriptional regulator, mexJK operon transcriptional repressor